MTRHEAREQAFSVLFEKSFDEEKTISDIIKNAGETELIKINNFAESVLKVVEENSEEIDTLIKENTRGWDISRLPRVSLAALRLAIAEIKYTEEVPTAVSVNEAIEIVRKFGTDEDTSFVNGILRTVSEK